MNGTPASSPGAWKGAAKTCTCTCPGPPSQCGYLCPACLAGEGRTTELSKEDRLALDTGVSGLSRSPPLCKAHCLPQQPQWFSTETLLPGWGEDTLSSCTTTGSAGQFQLCQYCLRCMNRSVCFSNYFITDFITRLHCLLLILWRKWKMRKSNCSTRDRSCEAQSIVKEILSQSPHGSSSQASSHDQWTSVGLTIVFLNVKGKTIKIGINC